MTMLAEATTPDVDSTDIYSLNVVPAKADAQPMTTALKRRLKSVEYQARAREAQDLADASPLAQVKERHEAAAARWMELAGQQESFGDDAERRAG